MRDEVTQTEANAIESYAAKLEEFGQAPDNLVLFRELKRKLKQEKRGTELAQLYELRAPCESVTAEATRLWHDAAVLRCQSGDTQQGMSNFRRALDLSPAHENLLFSISLYSLIKRTIPMPPTWSTRKSRSWKNKLPIPRV